MFKRIVYGTGAMGLLTAGYLLGSVSVGGVFAQTPPAASPSAQTAPSASACPEPTEQADTPETPGAPDQQNSGPGATD